LKLVRELNSKRIVFICKDISRGKKMRGAFTLLEINDGANNSDVITSLVYEICEFFAKRY
jgi:hypothetical protein